MENILMENITTYGDETSEINKKNWYKLLALEFDLRIEVCLKL